MNDEFALTHLKGAIGTGIEDELDNVGEYAYLLVMGSIADRNFSVTTTLLARDYLVKRLEEVISELKQITANDLLEQHIFHLKSILDKQENDRK